MSARTVSIREARQNLRTLLEDVLAGEEIILVRRGKPVARLTQVAEAPPGFPPLGAFRKSIKMRGGPLSEDVIAAREEERY